MEHTGHGIRHEQERKFASWGVWSRAGSTCTRDGGDGSYEGDSPRQNNEEVLYFGGGADAGEGAEAL